jgi:hypothetical protein
MTDLPDDVRRRLDAVFGEVLPEVTRDESPEEPPDAGRAAEERLRAERPPHHDRG